MSSSRYIVITSRRYNGITVSRYFVIPLFRYPLPLGGQGVGSLNHDLEANASSSFTFGKAETSFALRSLNHDLSSSEDIHALWQ